MPVRKGEAPKQLPAELKFSSTAEKLVLNVKFANHTSKEYREHKGTVGELVLWLVDEWDADFPLTVDGISDFEDEHPGVSQGLIEAWWRARTVALEKN